MTKHADTNPAETGIVAFFASGETHTYDTVLLVPSWVVAGPSSPLDTTLCALGIREYSGANECDMCHARGAFTDENDTVYCARCLLPGGDSYGVVQSRMVTFVPFD